MKIITDPASVYCEYKRGVSYNSSLGLYDTVERNENFYNDKQWEGVYAPKLTKPVFNFLKPVVNYYIATLISDDIAVDVELDRAPSEGEYDVTKIISSEMIIPRGTVPNQSFSFRSSITGMSTRISV